MVPVEGAGPQGVAGHTIQVPDLPAERGRVLQRFGRREVPGALVKENF